MVFSQKIKPFKITFLSLKGKADEVLRLGFPVKSVENGSLSLDMIMKAINSGDYRQEEGYIEFDVNEQLKKEYASFREGVQWTRVQSKIPMVNEVDESDMNLKKMIREFDLANSTPMQGLLFIQQLKRQVEHQ